MASAGLTSRHHRPRRGRFQQFGRAPMIQLTRRELFSGTAATTAALAMGLSPTELRAAAPAIGKQNAGFYRYKVGDFEVTQIADGARTFPMPDTFVVNQKKRS